MYTYNAQTSCYTAFFSFTGWEHSWNVIVFRGWFLRIYCEYMHYICTHWNTAGAVNDPGVHKYAYFLICFKFLQESNRYTALAEQRPNLTRDKGFAWGFPWCFTYGRVQRRWQIVYNKPCTVRVWSLMAFTEANAKETYTPWTPSLYLKRTEMIVKKMRGRELKDNKLLCGSCLVFPQNLRP